MCGIAGVVSFSERVDRGLLVSMNQLLAHRGPDDSGEWFSEGGEVGLANRRLAILDLSADGHQPMRSANGLHCLAHNGEIYNFVELRDELAGLGHAFTSHTDTEVILAAYSQWGDSCVEHFNGMFAFALWDAPRRRLFAARDRFGEKPFYYFHSPTRFVFASEIKAILLDPDVPRRPDDDVVARYLMLAQLDGDERTFFHGIRQLPPAHMLTIDADGRLETKRYWALELRETSKAGADENAGRFRELLLDAIRLRLRSDVSVGSSLSGGLDSSSIVCGVHRLLAGSRGPQQNTFSARYRTPGLDEGRFIEAVAQQTGVAAHHVWIEGDGVLQDLERFLWHQDEPVVHTSQYAQWKVMELAKQTGVTVLLDGQGADEILGGYPSPSYGYTYAGLLRRGRLGTLARELAAFRHHHGSVLPALRYMGAALLPEATRRGVRARYHATADLGLRAPDGRVAQAIEGVPPLRQALYEALTITSLPSLLRYSDRSSMAFSRESRMPFLDHRLVEFVYTLPPNELVSGGAAKSLLRRAMSGVIPDVVRDRTDKIGFATPEREWLLGPLRPWIEGALQRLKRRDVVRSSAIEGQWLLVQQGQGRTGNVWRLANLEHWLSQSIDRPPAATH